MIAFLMGGLVMGTVALRAQVVDGELEGTEERGPKNARVLLEWIETSQELVTELLAEEADGVDDTAMRAKLAEWIQAKKAFVFETQMVTARSGAPASTESVREEIHPGLYLPSELPGVVKVGHDSEGTAGVPVTSPCPTGFEMRMVGGSFELQPVVSSFTRDGEVRLDAEWVERVGTSVYGSFDDGRAKVDVKMPTYVVERTSGHYVTQRGKPMLIAVLTPADENGLIDRSRKHLLFLRVDVMPVGKE